MHLQRAATRTLPFVLAASVQISVSPLACAGEADPPAPLTGVARIRDDAERLKPLFRTTAAQEFLEASHHLPVPPERRVLINKAERRWLTPEEGSALTEDQRAGLEERAVDEQMYYNTFYGSPLVYARVIELAAQHGFGGLSGAKVLDFGYGSIGQLRLMACRGAHAVGVDVDHRLAAIYRDPSDTGPFPRTIDPASAGNVSLVHGQWPADHDAIVAVGADWRFDLITSKNTLKNGYINPARDVDERLLVRLGVTHDEFLRSVHDVLRPGGLFVIYNLSPRLSRDDEPYKPWSDGRCPFAREMIEAAGFEVLAFDACDDEAAIRIFELLGYPTVDQGGERDLFAHYTIVRRPGE